MLAWDLTKPNVEFAAVVAVLSGLPNCTRLNRLKISARNSSVVVSVMRVFLNNAKSKSDTPRGAGGLMSWAASKAVGPLV